MAISHRLLDYTVYWLGDSRSQIVHQLQHIIR